LNSARPPEQTSYDRAGGQELEPVRQAAVLVPAADAVGRKELAAARPGQREHVLEVGSRGGDRSDDRTVGRTARDGDETEQREPGCDLEAARADVPVRDPVAEEVRGSAGEGRATP
jgi:hypothetical protein